MKCVKIISKTPDNTFWCKRCKKSGDILYKINDDSYCEGCVPKEIANNCITINQNRERLE